MATKYNVIVNDTTVVTKSKRQTAIDFATELRETDKVAVRVETDKGTVVFEANAPKKIKMSPRYTKVQALPEGVELDESVAGLRVAYVRTRRNGAVLHDASAESGKQYLVVDLSTGKPVKRRFADTRDAGAFIRDGVGARRRELAALRAAAAEGGESPAPEQDDAPAPAAELIDA